MELEHDNDIEDGWAPGVVGRKGVRVMREKCSTCVFRPGNLMNLNRGRVSEMLADVRATDSFITCHKTLGGESHTGAICRGSNDAHCGQLMRMAERVGFVEQVDEASLID